MTHVRYELMYASLNETISSYKFENDLFSKIIYKNALFSKNGL